MGAYDEVAGGVLQMGNGSELTRDWNLGLLGDVGSVTGSDVTILPQRDLDAKCQLFRPLFEAVVGKDGIPASSV